jgi:RimJ/RimL family protein N-acetyltransferase
MPLTPPAPIETPRLVVRQITEADLPGLMAVNGDDTVTQFLPYATWRSIDDASAWYQRIAAIQATGNAVQFVILSRDDASVIGAGLLFNFNEGSARAELGYVLGRAHWGCGLAREAVAALVGVAFGSMGVRRLEAEVNPLNRSSVRLLQSLGFTREGLLRQRWVGKGSTYDVELHGLLSAEWQPAR